MKIITSFVTPSTRTANRSAPTVRRLWLLSTIAIAAAVVLSACVSQTQAMAEGIYLEVAGGKADVENWVAEATLDLVTARELIDREGKGLLLP